jgi:hypothetical protein
MKRIWLILLATVAMAGVANAQAVTMPPPAGTMGILCVFTTVPPTLTTTNIGFVQCDNKGQILTTVAVPVNPLGITPTDRTIASASGSSQQIMAANASRHQLIIQNIGNANCGVNPTGGTAAIGSAGTLTLLPAGSYQPRIPTLSAVTVICTAGQPIYAEEN